MHASPACCPSQSRGMPALLTTYVSCLGHFQSTGMLLQPLHQFCSPDASPPNCWSTSLPLSLPPSLPPPPHSPALPPLPRLSRPPVSPSSLSPARPPSRPPSPLPPSLPPSLLPSQLPTEILLGRLLDHSPRLPSLPPTPSLMVLVE